MRLSLLKRKLSFLLTVLVISLFTGLFFQNCGKLPESSGSAFPLGSDSGLDNPNDPFSPAPTPNPLPLTPQATETEFFKKIKPIFESRCLNCHSPGSIAAHLPFTTSDQIATKASFIKNAITSRSMPPFDVSQDEGCNSPSFANDPRLTQEQIDTVNTWIDQKVSAGKLKDANEGSITLSKAGTSKLITDGVSVFSALMKNSYTPAPPLGKVDQYRCFVLDPITSTDKFMTAYEVIPGNSALVHHMILYHPKTAADANTAQSKDTGSGYDCLGSAIVPADPLVIWAPGVGVQELPPQTGLRIAGGRKLILQVHYNTSNKSLGTSDKSKIQLRLIDSVTNPAEWISVGANSGSIPAGLSSYQVTGNSSIPSGYAGFYGVFPHMHSIGKKIRIENSTTNQCYSFTPNWRFTWQLNYFYNTMTPVTAGQQLQVKCTYDSTSRTSSTSFGEGSNDEMCFGFIYAVRPAITTPPPIDPPPTTSGFLLTPNITGTLNALNISTLINYITADVTLLKQIYVVAALPRNDGAADYYFLSGGTWNSAGTDLGAAVWTAFQSSQNKSSETLTITTATDITMQPVGTSVYVGYGVARDSKDAKADLLEKATWGLIYQKP